MADRKFNAKMEKGEVFKAPDGVIEKIPNTAPAHEQADSIAPATLILENTSAIRKDPYSRMLKITPEQFQNLTGFKAKADMSHSKAFEVANKKAGKLIDKHAKYLNSPNKGIDNFATNTANLNQLFSQQILEGDELFQTLFDNQETRKTYYEQTTGDDFSSEKVIGSEYQYGGMQYGPGGTVKQTDGDKLDYLSKIKAKFRGTPLGQDLYSDDYTLAQAGSDIIQGAFEPYGTLKDIYSIFSSKDHAEFRTNVAGALMPFESSSLMGAAINSPSFKPAKDALNMTAQEREALARKKLFMQGESYPVGGYNGRKGATQAVADYQKNVLGFTGKEVDGIWGIKTKTAYENLLDQRSKLTQNPLDPLVKPSLPGSPFVKDNKRTALNLSANELITLLDPMSDMGYTTRDYFGKHPLISPNSDGTFNAPGVFNELLWWKKLDAKDLKDAQDPMDIELRDDANFDINMLNNLLGNMESPYNTKPFPVRQSKYSTGGYNGRKDATREVADYQRNVLGLSGKDVDGIWGANTQALYQQHIGRVQSSLVPKPSAPHTPSNLTPEQATQMIGDVSYSSEYANDQFAQMMNLGNNPRNNTARLLKNILGQAGNLNFAGQDDPNDRVPFNANKEKVRRILANIDTGVYAKNRPVQSESTRVQRRYAPGGPNVPVIGNLTPDNPYVDYQQLLFNQSGMVGSQHPNQQGYYGNVTGIEGMKRILPSFDMVYDRNDPNSLQETVGEWQRTYNSSIKSSTDWLEKVGYVKPLQGLDLANQLRFSENPDQVNSIDGKLGEFTSNRQRLKMRIPGTKAGIYALDQIGRSELEAAGVSDPNILQHLSDGPDSSLLIDVEVVPTVDPLKPNQTQIPTLEGKMQPVDPKAAFSIKPNTPEEKVATTPPTGPAVGNPEKAKFNQPLNWYDVAGDTMGLLNSLVRDPEKYNPAQVHQLQLQLQDITPALRQNQSDYNALLQQLPDNQTGFINAANAFKIKLQGANQASAQVNAANTQIRNQEIQYNTQVRDRQSLLDQQARAVFQDKVDTSKSKQDEQKQLYWDNIFNKLAQNAKLNRMGQMILNSNPSLNQDGTGNQAVIQQQLLNYLSGSSATPGGFAGFSPSRIETAGDGKVRKIVHQPTERVTKQNERKFTIK